MTWKDAFKFGVMIAVGGLLVNGIAAILFKCFLAGLAAIAAHPGVGTI
jgi:hypothetical protein